MVSLLKINIIFKLLQVSKFNDLFDSMKYKDLEV